MPDVLPGGFGKDWSGRFLFTFFYRPLIWDSRPDKFLFHLYQYFLFMKLVLQRVSQASVQVDGREISRISQGLMVLLGLEKGDGEETLVELAKKMVNLRIFEDDQGKMNLSLLDIQGEALVVSQFTLAGDCSRGRRPGFDKAAPPDLANELYLKFVDEVQRLGVPVQTGQFGATMSVEIQNEGPVTFILER